MSNLCKTPNKFEESFMMYEHNRMYPPRYRKDSAMIKLSMEHVNAICHSEFFVQGSTGKVPEPAMRKQLEYDLLKLAELKLYIIDSMKQPAEELIEDDVC